MRLITSYMIGLLAVSALAACAPQDTATAENESAASTPSQTAAAAAPVPVICQTCGVVRSVTEIRQQGSSTGAGAVVGAIVGGVAGNQVGGGSGQDIATAAGAIGGALLGNNIEQNRNATAYYEVVVAMENGRQEVINLQTPGTISSGTAVYVQGGNISLR